VTKPSNLPALELNPTNARNGLIENIDEINCKVKRTKKTFIMAVLSHFFSKISRQKRMTPVQNSRIPLIIIKTLNCTLRGINIMGSIMANSHKS
jgi:hypothetical protein